MSRVDLYFLLQNLDIPLLRFYDNLVRKENTFDNRIMSKNASSNISKFSLMRQSFNKCVASRRTPILVSTELAQHVCIGGEQPTSCKGYGTRRRRISLPIKISWIMKVNQPIRIILTLHNSYRYFACLLFGHTVAVATFFVVFLLFKMSFM